jgi:hypothetical protein
LPGEFALAIGQDDLRAALRQALGERPADARSPTRHDGDGTVIRPK